MLKLLNFSKSYGQNVIFKNLNFEFNQLNTIYTILGESGTGKTTLFNLLYGIDQDFVGEYYIDNKSTKSFSDSDWDNIRNKKIGIVFQDYKLLENLTVYENLSFAYSLEEKTKDDRINEVLELMNLTKIASLKVKKISGGQKQRLAIGRAILNKPLVLLLDEPTGNLDDKNTSSIIKYILELKEDSIVIIITHDQRIIPYSDIVLRLGNQNLEVTKKSKEKPTSKVKCSVSNTSFKKVNLLKYLFSSLKSRWTDLVISNISVCAIICMFIAIFSMVTLNYESQLKVLFNGLSENAIYISSSNIRDDYIEKNKKKGIAKIDDGSRINFSESDLENVKKIPHISNARLYNSSTISLYDREKYRLNYRFEKKEFPDQLKKVPSYSSAPTSVSFAFNTMNIPYDFASSLSKISVISGDFPKDNTDEILIPDIIAYSFFGKIKDVVGEIIVLNVYDEKMDFKDKEYIVSGVYETDFDRYMKDSYEIYVNYIEYPFLDLFLSEETYLSMKKSDVEFNMKVKNYSNPLYETYNNYVKAIGTNLGDLIIKVDKEENIKEVSNELQKLFSNLKIISQYELKNGESASAFKQIKMFIMLGSLAVAMVLGIIIIFLNKGYIRTRNKELSILYSLGYSKINVSMLIILEYVFITIVNLIVAYIILKIMQVLYFGASANYELFDLIFSSNQIVQVIIYMALMIAISALFSLRGINKKKLRQYLEGNS